MHPKSHWIFRYESASGTVGTDPRIRIQIRIKMSRASGTLVSYLDSVEEAQLGRVAKDDNHPVLDDGGGVARTVDLPAELTVAPAPVHRLHLPGEGVQVEGPQLLRVKG